MSKELNDYRDPASFEIVGKEECHFINKPIIGGIVTLLFSVAFFLIPGIVFRIFGSVLILACLYLLFVYRSRKVLGFYPEGVLIYKEMDDTKAMYFPYKEVSRWSCKRSNYGTQVLVMMNAKKDYVYAEAFDLRSLRKTMLHYMPDKEFKEKEGKK